MGILFYEQCKLKKLFPKIQFNDMSNRQRCRHILISGVGGWDTEGRAAMEACVVRGLTTFRASFAVGQ